MTISPPDVVLGAQQPRLRSVPPYASSAGAEAIELAASAGLVLDPWQRLVLTDALGERPDGKWSAFEVGLVVARQNGKGSVLEALELAGLFLFGDPDGPPPLILHSAHEFKTSAEHFRRMRDLVDGADHLRKRVRIVRTAAGSESIELTSGARLRFVTRTGGSGRGFSADTIVIDEAYNLTAESMAAVLPTLSARPNPQVWYTSSAGMTSSEQLARVRARGARGDDPRLAYFEWSADDGADLDDVQAWAAANPALGLRIPLDFVLAERLALPDEQFARERLGLWADKSGRGEVVFPEWLSLADPAAERGRDVVFGLDVAEDRTASISVGWRRPDGAAQVMLVESVPAFRAAERCAELTGRWGGRVVAPRSMVAEIEQAGVSAVELRLSEFAAACGRFADAVSSGGLRHGNQPELNAAVGALRWRSGSSGERVFDLKAGGAAAGPAVAAVRALHGLTSVPTGGGWVLSL